MELAHDIDEEIEALQPEIFKGGRKEEILG